MLVQNRIFNWGVYIRGIFHTPLPTRVEPLQTGSHVVCEITDLGFEHILLATDDVHLGAANVGIIGHGFEAITGDTSWIRDDLWLFVHLASASSGV
jgi:hypothetical protein